MQILIYFAIMLVTYAISSATASKAQQQKPAGLEAFDFPQTEEGTPQCVFFGDCWTSDWVVLSYGNLYTRPIRSKGGKK